MESSSGSVERPTCEILQAGDRVLYRRDGTRGIVYSREGDLCQILWEDEFVSWEKTESLLRL